MILMPVTVAIVLVAAVFDAAVVCLVVALSTSPRKVG